MLGDPTPLSNTLTLHKRNGRYSCFIKQEADVTSQKDAETCGIQAYIAIYESFLTICGKKFHFDCDDIMSNVSLIMVIRERSLSF